MKEDRYVFTDAVGRSFYAAADGVRVEVRTGDDWEGFEFRDGAWHREGGERVDGGTGLPDSGGRSLASLLTRASMMGRGRRLVRDSRSR